MAFFLNTVHALDPTVLVDLRTGTREMVNASTEYCHMMYYKFVDLTAATGCWS